MKKRFISLLLTVLMILSLFSGLSVNAYAATTAYGANTIEYTMGQGDYVLRICQQLGLNYYTCKDAIQILNNIYDGQWNTLTVGRVLTLPASDADAVLIANGARQTTVNTGAAATTLSTAPIVTGTYSTANTATFNTGSAASADTLNYYLVPYTMSYGETVSGVCNNLGVNFSIFSPFIKQVNNITNWNKVKAGDTILVPTPVCPSVGTTCYGVMQHIVKSSDTAYGIVNSKGINYNANEQLLKVLNQTDNLASLKAGGNFFYPVPLTVSVPGTGNPGSTATTTTTTTVTDGNGTTTTQTTTTAKLYKLTSGMSASDGTMLFYVNSQPVTAAPAGAKVTVVTSTNSGKALQSLTVKHSDGKADIHLTGDTFVMPSCDVRVDSSVTIGHDINITANYSGKATASVGGISVQSAVKGAAVVIKSVDPNYEISSISASYKKLITASTKTTLAISSSKAFIMPDADVEVVVTLKPVSTYAFYVNDPMNGNFYLEVNGNAVTRAAKGATVTVVAKPNTGYEAKKLVVKNHLTGERVNVFSNTFTMPAFDVDVEVTFTGKGNNILIMPSQMGNVYAFDDITATDVSEFITDAETGTVVYLVAVNEDDVIPEGLTKANSNISYDVVRNSDGLKVKCDYVGEGWAMTVDDVLTTSSYFKFTMPKGGVTVTPNITATVTSDITSKFFMNGDALKAKDGYKECSFSITWNNKTSEFTKTGETISTLKNIKSKIPAGEYIDLRYDSSEGVAFIKYRILNGNKLLEEETNEANLYGYFKMPAADITIEAYFETGKAAIGPAAITGIGSVGYKVLDDNGNWKSANTCEPGDEVLIVVTPGNGYKFDDSRYDTRLFVSRKDNGAPVEIRETVPTLQPGTFAYTFTMPASGADVRAIFDPAPFVITMHCVDEAGNDLTGLGLWQIAIDWVPGVLDNTTNITWHGFETRFDVAYGDYVTVAMTEAGWSKYDMVSFRINDLEYTADQLNYFYNFQMIDDRAKDLTITAVLRPKTVSAIHNLIAMYDVTKGGVEFMIVNSPSHYSDEYRINSMGALNYVNKAIAGDKVAIVANSVDSKYTVKAKDINIIGWGTDADRIIPTEGWIDAFGNSVASTAPGAIRVFTFTMPDSDVNVTVNYTGKQQGMMISVFDMDNNPLNGMVRLFAGNIARDVASPASYDDIPYKTPVTITRSELALAESKVIKDVDIHTESGKSINYTDMSNAGEGIQFMMPDEPVWVIIRVDDFHINAPTVVIDTQVVGGALYFRRSANTTDPIVPLADFDPGETVYVFDEPALGFDHLGIGDLKIFVNGMQNAVNIQEVANRPHVWSFTMREGTLILKADFPLEGADTVAITVNVVDVNGNAFAAGKVDVITGGSINTITGSSTFNALEGQTIAFLSDTDGYTVYRVQSASGKGVTGSTYVVPELSEATPKLQDTLTVTLAVASNPIKTSATGGYLEFRDTKANTGNNITSADTGKPVYIVAHENDGYKTLKEVDLKITSIETGAEITPESGNGTDTNPWKITMPAGGINATAAFEASADAQIKIINDHRIKITSSAGTGYLDAGSKMFTLPVGSTITIEAAEDGYDKVTLTSVSTKGVSGNTYTVPSEAANGGDTLSVVVTSSSNPIIKSTITGGDLLFSKTSGMSNLISAAEVGDTVYVSGTPSDGYGALKQSDLHIIGISSGAEIATTAVNTNVWSFEMPAGGVLVNASFGTDKLNLKITVADGLYAHVVAGDLTGDINGTKYVALDAGTVITVTSATEGYDEVTLSADKGTVSGNKYTVTDDGATLTIKLSSSAKAVTLKVTSDTKFGNISLAHTNSKAVAEPASAFKVGDPIYLFDSPVTGYELDADSLKVVENISGNEYILTNGIAKDTTTGCYVISGVSSAIPEGGITIKASFKAKTINVAFSGNGQVTASSASAEYTVDAAATPTVQFKFGETVTLTPAGSFKWGTATVDGTAIAGATKQFKITSENPISVVLAP